MSINTYIPFSEQDKLRASEVDLVLFLQCRGERLERAGQNHKLIYTDGSGTHDSITVSGNKWFDHKNKCGGGPIKFLREHYGMSYQVIICKGGILPPNTYYDCGSFVVNRKAVIGKEKKSLVTAENSLQNGAVAYITEN